MIVINNNYNHGGLKQYQNNTVWKFLACVSVHCTVTTVALWGKVYSYMIILLFVYRNPTYVRVYTYISWHCIIILIVGSRVVLYNLHNHALWCTCIIMHLPCIIIHVYNILPGCLSMCIDVYTWVSVYVYRRLYLGVCLCVDAYTWVSVFCGGVAELAGIDQ